MKIHVLKVKNKTEVYLIYSKDLLRCEKIMISLSTPFYYKGFFGINFGLFSGRVDH